jgi:hypothetical protein
MKVNIGKYHNNGSPRTIKVQIDPWDTVSADHTLALIILPVLKQFRAKNNLSPDIDNKDVPAELHKKLETYYAGWDKRWAWVVDEMIFAFEHIVDHEWELMYFGETKDLEGFEKVNERIANGLRLFGKYYRGLWT